MNDTLPPESGNWEFLEQKVRKLMRRFAFENIRTPIVENTALFVRGLGEVTDIVEKEMYSFDDRLNGEALTLRPEGTAGVVRAAIEHSLLYDGGKRLYYIGPMFRHERPQRGRYRQFHQIGAEALGFSGGEVDAELILMAVAFWQEIGLQDVELQLNSLGQPEERRMHRAALVAYFESNFESLDEEAKRRLHTNPLRLLDSKNPAMQQIIETAPKLLDFLGAASKRHLSVVTAALDANSVAYRINPRLVRGMDYYNLTVFEFVTNRLGSQGTICAGGRYDYLMEQVGGKPTPAVGWAIGIERVLELLKEQGNTNHSNPVDAYAIVWCISALAEVSVYLQKLRQLGVSVQMHTSTAGDMASMKSQFKKADSSGAKYALVFGPDELAAGKVAIKSLRGTPTAQILYSLDEINFWAKSLQPTA